MEYKDTVFLPKTNFLMRGDLPKREPAFLDRWEKMAIYTQLRQSRAGKTKYILHDGPPYANGNLHIGHAINKVLKDIIVKSRQMSGFDAAYVPGWDCHGLPIELKAEEEQKAAGRSKDAMPVAEFRQKCREFAGRWVDVQRIEFKRLGVFGDWDHPYLTMDYRFEADIVRELGKFLVNGGLYKGFKPVYWCPNDVTALAEAEVEYQDHASTAITVKFPLAAGESLADVHPALENQQVAVAIWTTTPWTLPANLAVCLNPQYTYVAVQFHQVGEHPSLQAGEIIILAEGLWESAVVTMGLSPDQCHIVAAFPGRGLDRKKFRHPWLDQDAPIVLAGHVTLEAGTGCVHTAPGHGQEDYVVGQQYGLPVFNPVDDRGVFVPETPHVAGMFVRKADPVVVALLEEKGMLLAKSTLVHSYPHCWRCRKPLITRATPQWFISMAANQLRQRALQAIQETRWIPAYGVDRIGNMVANRPDWCVSRQRSWGVPIAIITCTDCHAVVSDGATMETVAQKMEQHGADVWYTREATAFLPENAVCPQCGGRQFSKEKDILDVWFDSGVTHTAVLKRRPELAWPADLYLEGSDQHRGWFHSSLLTSIGVGQQAPYRAVLTHGFVVDGKGRKMSKSQGNVVAPEKVIQQYGADILRMWASAEDYTGDIRISDEILKGLSEAYRRIRNTIRFLLGNLDGFDPASNPVSYAEMPELDRWALARLATLTDNVLAAYEGFAFHRVYQELHYFCSVDMGAFYLDVLKDRLYCDDLNSTSRQAARTALDHILEGLVRLMAPIFSFTAEEIWDAMRGPRQASVHLAEFIKPQAQWSQGGLEERWNRFRQVRGEAYRLLEADRQEKRIGSFMQAVVDYYAEPELKAFLQGFAEPHRLLIVSQVLVHDLSQAPPEAVDAVEITGLKIRTRVAGGEKCARCWNWDKQVGSFEDHPQLCGRCRQVILAMEAP